MRDPGRIDPLIELLRAYWKENPDLRMGQLFESVKALNQGPIDSFYVEDPEWLILLKQNTRPS